MVENEILESGSGGYDIWCGAVVVELSSFEWEYGYGEFGYYGVGVGGVYAEGCAEIGVQVVWCVGGWVGLWCVGVCGMGVLAQGVDGFVAEQPYAYVHEGKVCL